MWVIPVVLILLAAYVVATPPASDYERREYLRRRTLGDISVKCDFCGAYTNDHYQYHGDIHCKDLITCIHRKLTKEEDN